MVKESKAAFMLDAHTYITGDPSSEAFLDLSL